MKCMIYSNHYQNYQMYIVKMAITLLQNFCIYPKTFHTIIVNIGTGSSLIHYYSDSLSSEKRGEKQSLRPQISSNIMILVKSGRNSFSDRFQLRRILNSSPTLSNFAFLIGTSTGKNKNAQRDGNLLRMEMQEYDDIIVADFFDTYENLPLKTKSMYKFAADYCIKERLFYKFH